MTCKEFNNKYEIYDVLEIYDKNGIIDYLVMMGIAWTLLFVFVVERLLFTVNMLIAILVGSIVLITYYIWRIHKKKEYVKDERFLDININLIDGNAIYQVRIDTLLEDDSGRIIINGEFILNYDKYLLEIKDGEDILMSFVDDVKVLTPWGLCSGNVNMVEVVHIDECEIEGKTLPVLSILLTGAGIRATL